MAMVLRPEYLCHSQLHVRLSNLFFLWKDCMILAKWGVKICMDVGCLGYFVGAWGRWRVLTL